MIPNCVHRRLGMGIWLISLLMTAPSYAVKPICEKDYSKQVQAEVQIAATDEPIWDSLTQTIKNATGHRLKYPLVVRSDEGVDLSVNPSDYPPADDNKRFRVSRVPVIQHGEVEWDVQFGYPASTSSKRIGTLNYIVRGDDGTILEVGAPSPIMLAEFKSHIFGRELTPKMLERVIEANQKIYNYLTSLPEHAKHLADFEASRGWPKGLATQMKLLYFDQQLLSLRKWADNNNITPGTLRDAGWMQMRFDDDGLQYYVPTSNQSIRIPFFMDKEQTKVIAWTTRLINPMDPKVKYLPTPLNKSYTAPLPVQAHLYNSWLLENARGKTIVITEGEFKAAISTLQTGIIHVGDLGIGEFDDTCLKAIVNAQPGKVIIVHDRDPEGMALDRVDEVTDADRAAYTIAQRLQKAGINVYIGTLPRLEGASKVGADDYILKKGPAEYKKVLNLAVSPEEFARARNLDPSLQSLLYHHRELEHALEKYDIALTRGAEDVPEIYNQALTEIERIEALLDHYFKAFFKKQTANLFQPSARYPSLPSAAYLPHGLYVSSKRITLENLKKSILLLEFDGLVTQPLHEQIAQRLSALYPPETFDFVLDVYFSIVHEDVVHTSDTVPVAVVRKDNGRIYAFADLKLPGRLSLRQKLRNYLRPYR